MAGCKMIEAGGEKWSAGISGPAEEPPPKKEPTYGYLL